jgi:DUF2075 family protein
MPAFYCNTFENHSNTSTEEIVGEISKNYSKYHLNLKNLQTESWIDTINLFKDIYKNLLNSNIEVRKWGILYEYKIPRRSKRIDITIITKNIIFIIEFKNHEKIYKPSDISQLEDYCLDIRDFHFESKHKIIVPILLCTEAKSFNNLFEKSDDFVQRNYFANRKNISEILININGIFDYNNVEINYKEWNNSKYSPTPTIIEFAQSLYAGQSVLEISRNGAGEKNLTNTTLTILNAINDARKNNSKIICFITGVPGAGKTLAGLNVVHNREFKSQDEEIAVFLSGNSPLVKVLSEALARDFIKREKINKVEAKRRVKTFIHNVHEFIDEYYEDKSKIPVDRVIIYDEAQRAWTKEHKSRKSRGLINESEPDILLSIMDRFVDWGVIIALVGNGQEINTGEGGLSEWGNSIQEKFKNWKVYISPELQIGRNISGNLKLFENRPKDIEIIESESLHLNTSIRSYKASYLSNFVSLVLENKNLEAELIYKEKLINFPLYITRDIDIAKKWLQNKSRGTRRIGLISSSGGRRLRTYGYDPYYGLRGDSSQDELGNWYLNTSSDVRSSNFMEVIATEYAVQGLELDWTGLLWDADLRRTNNQWNFKQFKGTKWQNVGDEQKKQYILNKYRVLLTRAREGMILFIPEGSHNDITRLPEFYNETYEFLKSCGIISI